MPFPHQLPDIHLADDAHLGGASVSEVGVMSPDRDAGLAVVLMQVLDKRVDRVCHVRVAEVP
jgi:hypothetical protein